MNSARDLLEKHKSHRNTFLKKKKKKTADVDADTGFFISIQTGTWYLLSFTSITFVLINSHLVDNIEGDFGLTKKWVDFPKKTNLEQLARVGQRQTTSNISEHLDIVHGWLARSIWACSHSSDNLQFLNFGVFCFTEWLRNADPFQIPCHDKLSI